MVSFDRKSDFNKNILIREISAYAAIKKMKNQPRAEHARMKRLISALVLLFQMRIPISVFRNKNKK
jgi:hypothetical protein